MDTAKKAPLPLPVPGQNNEFMQKLDQANGVVLQANVGDDVKLDVTLLCADASTANDIKKVTDAALVLGKDNKNVPKEIQDLMKTDLKVNGNNVTASITFKVGPLIQAFKKQMKF